MDNLRELAVRYHQSELELTNHPRPDCLEADLEGRRLLGSGIRSPLTGLDGYSSREELVNSVQSLGAGTGRPDADAVLASTVRCVFVFRINNFV